MPENRGALRCCRARRAGAIFDGMSAPAEDVAAATSESPLDAFQGTFPPTKIGPLYTAGLAVVAFAMVLLPLIYIGLICFAGWAVVFHLTHNLWIFEGSGGALFRMIAYLGPAAAGVILIFFMVKPFFAARAKPPPPVTLDPAREPLLFAFVEKICGLVRAPVPCRIDVDCQVNASASLKRGFWSRDLVLTIGLPLVSGLDLRQFAGVLAHEFGHFAQGAGMRLTYIIRMINFWFARVLYERDAWDVRLEESARQADLRIGVVLHAARGCVWLTRRILWAFMHAGHAISCFMLRQMEFDADSYEAKLAGSDTFAVTASKLRLLNVATQVAYEDVRQSWAGNRLPENLPLLIDHKARCLPAEVCQKVSAAAAAEKTSWHDTHPCDADRIRAVEKLNEPGVFRLTGPATTLFSDFADLCRRVTQHHYRQHLELDFSEENLMSSEELLRESAANPEAQRMIRKYYGQVNISLKPLWISDSLFSGDPAEPDAASNHAHRMEELRPVAEQVSDECAELQERLGTLTAAHALSRAGFTLDPGEFGLPGNATSLGKQQSASRAAMAETARRIAECLAKLDPFMAALRHRVTALLQRVRNQFDDAQRHEMDRLVALAAALGREMPALHDIGSRLHAFTLLGQNRTRHTNIAQVDGIITEMAQNLQRSIDEIQERLQAFPYPFPHPRGRLSVADYARTQESTNNAWQPAYVDCHTHLERLFPLHYRVLGKILAMADAAEAGIGANEPYRQSA